ncbi:tetratricopeptide repeat protein, partial [Streptomyces sp. NPDC087903]|uniref:tetratricopeptide repeat protein n=1 Tax=Streptomyces sp. NPDC087903 TaxID=3365819 RepID=UPI0037FE748F
MAELACRVPSGAPTEQEVKRFHDLWDAAAADVLPELDAALKVAAKAAADGDYSEAIRLGTQLLAASELAPDSPQSLELRHKIATWRGEAGDAQGAAAALTDLVHDRAHVLGPDHPDTLESREELAIWLGNAGNTASAAAALPEVVQDRTRVQGADHPDTLTARHNAAYWQGEAGDAQGAAAAFADLVRDRTRVQGPD